MKLIDVYPEDDPEDAGSMGGFELMVADEVFRGALSAKSFEKPEAIHARQVRRTRSICTPATTFKKGHRIMVQVQSTWFPLYDRNPQKFVPNIFEAKASDYVKATQQIYRSKKFPSSVEVSVLPNGASTLRRQN